MRSPKRLRTQYMMDSWGVSCREGLDHLLARYPQTTVRVLFGYATEKGWGTFPKEDRERLVLVREGEGFRNTCGKTLNAAPATLPDDAVFSRKLYNSTILRVEAASVEPST